MSEKWMLTTKRADFDAIAKEHGISPVIARLIINRGVREEQVGTYLHGDLTNLHDPYLLKDMDQAVRILNNVISGHMKIAIASDFDCDGIFAGMILYRGFERLGIESKLYTPHRVQEGYGLNNRIVDEAVEDGCKILITCDNGIAAFDAIDYAKEKGMTVIITDHHEVPYEDIDGVRNYRLPNADAIVNPKQEDCHYPFKGICGGVVAYKLIQAMYLERSINIEEMQLLLPYAAIATVADVMNLCDENRIIVKMGLKLLSETKDVGLHAILTVCKLTGVNLTAYHIGFVIGPCFNASGRLETVKIAQDLLLSTDPSYALRKAEYLKELNDQRKELTEQGKIQALEYIEMYQLKNNKILVVYLPDCHESLAGIIAGRLKELYCRPTFVFVKTEHGLKGSGRSIPAYSMYEELVRCKHLLGKFGGHPMAAGVSLPEENLKEFTDLLNKNATITEEDMNPIVSIDIPLPLDYLSEAFIQEMSLLEPYGNGNQKPVFAEQHFSIIKIQILGKNQNVMKLRVKNRSNVEMDAMCFHQIDELSKFMIEEYGQEQYDLACAGRTNNIDIAFTYFPDINEYNGYKTVQIVVQNFCHIVDKH